MIHLCNWYYVVAVYRMCCVSVNDLLCLRLAIRVIMCNYIYVFVCARVNDCDDVTNDIIDRPKRKKRIIVNRVNVLYTKYIT